MEDHIMPLSNVLLDMRIGGMRLDRDELQGAIKNMEADVNEWRDELPDWKPTARGVRTENQGEFVRQHLYEKLKLPVQTVRGGDRHGSPTADKDALKTLRQMILTQHKKVEKLSTPEAEEALGFIDLILKLKDKSKTCSEFNKYWNTGVTFVHPTLNPAGTGTFRFSANDPNVQQIAKCRCKPKCYGTNPHCKGARHVFLPDEKDWLIVRFDIRQAEVVTFLWYAKAWDILSKALKEGFDVHQLIADKMGFVRDDAKTTTFATLYGESEATTVARSRKSMADVQAMRAAFANAMPGVDDFRSHFVGMAMQYGYVETPFRTRRIIRVESPYGRAANQAGNATVQAVPPWVLRRAMIKLHKDLPKPARLWCQIHDEVDIITPPELLEEVIECAHTHITAPVPELPASPIGMHSGLQFISDIEVGRNFGSLYSLDKWRALSKEGKV
jgi:DNA polymerase I-like protein with 3'-5' exonuclease and polymerase domains